MAHDDGALQGDDPDRPGLTALIDSLPELDVVILRSQDRISRDIGIWAVTSAALRAAGVRVFTFTAEMDLESPQGEFMGNVLAAVGKFEKRQTGQRVSQALKARARAGLPTGGPAPYGYWWEDKALVVADREAEIVRRIYRDYTNGVSQRALVRELNADGVPTRHGEQWRQSAIARILAAPIYTGRLEFKGEIIDGAHEPIVSAELWSQAERTRGSGHQRKGGRNADGQHLLVRGILKCPSCGYAMLPRKARPGVERERYVCSGRVEHGPEFCSQPSIRRELIDEPFLGHLLNGHFDLEATRKRFEERMQSGVALAREALRDAEVEVAKKEEATTRVERDYLEGKLDADDWARFKARLADELSGARAALERADEHVRAIDQAGVVGDAEQALLDLLAELKRATGTRADAAPNLNALRNVLGQMFEKIPMAPWDEGLALAHGEGSRPSARGRVPVETARGRYWLLPKLAWSLVDAGTLSPIGQEMPVGRALQYPPSDLNPFLSRYCWW